jgi:hypothetical protein
VHTGGLMMAKYRVTVWLDRYKRSRLIDVDENALSEDDLDEIGREVVADMVTFKMEKVEEQTVYVLVFNDTTKVCEAIYKKSYPFKMSENLVTSEDGKTKVHIWSTDKNEALHRGRLVFESFIKRGA